MSHSWHVCSCVLSDIQEFYEVTLLDSQRWVESSKAADPMAPVHLWDFSSLQSTTVTSDTLPSLSTSIEVRPDGSLGTGSEFFFLCLSCSVRCDDGDRNRTVKIENIKNRSHLWKHDRMMLKVLLFDASCLRIHGLFQYEPPSLLSYWSPVSWRAWRYRKDSGRPAASCLFLLLSCLIMLLLSSAAGCHLSFIWCAEDVLTRVQTRDGSSV